MAVHSFPNSAYGEQRMPSEGIISTIVPPPLVEGLHHHWLEPPLTPYKDPILLPFLKEIYIIQNFWQGTDLLNTLFIHIN